MITIYTANIVFNGADRLDITANGVDTARNKGLPAPGSCLAPSGGLLSWALKQIYEYGDSEDTRRCLWPEYSRRYIEEVRDTYRKDKKPFEALLRRSSLVLVCYCKDASYCHRRLAADILVKLSDGHAQYEGEVTDGEMLLALTLSPEWAYAYGYLGKCVENRTWRSDKVIGRWIAIHGGKYIGGTSHTEDAIRDDHRRAIAVMLETGRAAGVEVMPVSAREILTYGRGIVALAKVDRFLYGEQRGWYMGRPKIGWNTPQVVVLEAPVPCRGAQGLWPVPAGERLQVIDRLPKNAPGELVRQLQG